MTQARTPTAGTPARRPAQDGAGAPRLAVQCALLSHRGGGLPAAVLPVATRISTVTPFLRAVEPPEQPVALPVETVSSRRLLLPGGSGSLRDAALVHTHAMWTAMSVAALRWRRRTGRPTIVSPHGMLDAWALGTGSLKKQLALSVLERAHMNGSAFVHALNRAEAQAIRDVGVTAPIATVPNGVDLPEGRSLPPPGWMDRPTLLFLGRLHPKKGISELIAGFALAQDRLSGWQLAIAGWDDGPNGFRAEAEATGARILFPGPLFGEAKAAAYRRASAFVLSSRSEGLPISVLEAWAHALPVLMTDACNLPEGFAAGAAARLPLDPQGIGSVLGTVLPDEGWRRTAGSRGRELVIEQFTWDRIAATFEDLYAWALGRGPRPACVSDATPVS